MMEVVYWNNEEELLSEDVTLFGREMLLEGSRWESVKHDRNSIRDMRFYSDGIHMGYCNGQVHKVLHITSEQALQCAQPGEAETRSTPPVKLFPADIRKVHTAREILLHDLQHPPSMTLLAMQTGLNTFKLKAGFKQVFGNSVFGYLKDYRLEQARVMIREGGKTITAVAYETGYSTLQHFSNEFRKKFGISPKGMRD